MVLESLNFILIKLTYVVVILIVACVPLDDYISLFIHSLAHRHLGFSQSSDVMYSATITLVYIFPSAYVQWFLLHIYVEAKCWKSGRLTLWENARTIFPGSRANLLAGMRSCLSICPSTWCEQTFQFFQMNGCKIASHCGPELHFLPHHKWCWIFLIYFLVTCVSLSVSIKYPFISFAHFSSGLFILLVLIGRASLCRSTNPFTFHVPSIISLI